MMSDYERAEAKALRKQGMGCNCDLDNWQPEPSTGHSHVCRIHKRVQAIKRGDAAQAAEVIEE